MESVVPQARRTQGRLKIWLPRWDVHDRGARVLQAGTLMLVHTDHWALDPPAYLQHAKEKNCILPPVMFNGTPVGNSGGWILMKGEFSLPISLSSVNIIQMDQF